MPIRISLEKEWKKKEEKTERKEENWGKMMKFIKVKKIHESVKSSWKWKKIHEGKTKESGKWTKNRKKGKVFVWKGQKKNHKFMKLGKNSWKWKIHEGKKFMEVGKINEREKNSWKWEKIHESGKTKKGGSERRKGKVFVRLERPKKSHKEIREIEISSWNWNKFIKMKKIQENEKNSWRGKMKKSKKVNIFFSFSNLLFFRFILPILPFTLILCGKYLSFNYLTKNRFVTRYWKNNNQREKIGEKSNK